MTFRMYSQSKPCDVLELVPVEGPPQERMHDVYYSFTVSFLLTPHLHAGYPPAHASESPAGLEASSSHTRAKYDSAPRSNMLLRSAWLGGMITDQCKL